MTQKPLLNALTAELYIIVVALLMYYGSQFAGPVESVIVPIALLSLFVLSAAVMGYIFCLEPLTLYLNGEKKRAVELFITTVSIFAGLTFMVFLILFLIVATVDF